MTERIKVKRIKSTSGYVMAPFNRLTRQYRCNHSFQYQAQDGSGRYVVVYEYWRELANGETDYRCLAFFPDRFSAQGDRAGLCGPMLWLDLVPHAIAKRLLSGQDCDPTTRRLALDRS